MNYKNFITQQKEIISNYEMGFITETEMHYQLMNISFHEIGPNPNPNSLNLDEHILVKSSVEVYMNHLSQNNDLYKALNTCLTKLDFHINRLQK